MMTDEQMEAVREVFEVYQMIQDPEASLARDALGDYEDGLVLMAWDYFLAAWRFRELDVGVLRHTLREVMAATEQVSVFKLAAVGLYGPDFQAGMKAEEEEKPWRVIIKFPPKPPIGGVEEIINPIE